MDHPLRALPGHVRIAVEHRASRRGTRRTDRRGVRPRTRSLFGALEVRDRVEDVGVEGQGREVAPVDRTDPALRPAARVGQEVGVEAVGERVEGEPDLGREGVPALVGRRAAPEGSREEVVPHLAGPEELGSATARGEDLPAEGRRLVFRIGPPRRVVRGRDRPGEDVWDAQVVSEHVGRVDARIVVVAPDLGAGEDEEEAEQEGDTSHGDLLLPPGTLEEGPGGRRPRTSIRIRNRSSRGPVPSRPWNIRAGAGRTRPRRGPPGAASRRPSVTSQGCRRGGAAGPTVNLSNGVPVSAMGADSTPGAPRRGGADPTPARSGGSPRGGRARSRPLR